MWWRVVYMRMCVPDESVMRIWRILISFVCLTVISLSMVSCDKPEFAIAGQRDRSVRYTDIKVGSGSEAVEGKQVACHYRGYLPDGEEFMNTRKMGRGKAHVWRIGDGTVIMGIDVAVRGMKPGGVRETVLPPEMHWGNSGYGGVIPQEARLRFVIEMVRVR